MGFGSGKGFTRLKTTFTGSGVVLTPGGWWRFLVAPGKLIASRTAAASGASSTYSTSGKLTSSRTTEVT